MSRFTEREKAYIKEFVLTDLQDKAELIADQKEAELLEGIMAKLKELCDA